MIYAELKTWSLDHTERKTFYVQAFDAPVSKAQESKILASQGYGADQPLPYRLYYLGKRYRVKYANYGNSGTLYIGKPGEWIATVERLDPVPNYAEFLAFKQAYIGAFLWSETDDSGNPLDSKFDQFDLSREAEDATYSDCLAFWLEFNSLIMGEHAPMIEYNDSDNTEGKRKAAQAGHDFLLTRNGHGVGFWESEWSKADPQGKLDSACGFGNRFKPVSGFVAKGKVWHE